jgi:hypothetical protein
MLLTLLSIQRLKVPLQSVNNQASVLAGKMQPGGNFLKI